MIAPLWWTALKLMFISRLYPSQEKVARVKRYMRALLYLFNIHTLILAALACISVYICDKYRFSYNMDLTLVATGTTFPLVFNIQQAFTRREKALTLIANLKASAVALYFMHRDWAQDEGFPGSLGNDHTAAALHCKLLLMDLMRDVRRYLVANSPWESYAEQRLEVRHHPYVNMLLADMSLSGASQMSFAAAMESSTHQDPATAALRRCYRGFSRLSVLNERLGLRSGYTKGGEGGMSRTNQYLRYIMANLEELRMIKEYRTPIMMRYANGVLLHIFAVALAPYFVHFCDSWQALGYSRSSCPAGYSAAIVFTVIVMLLFHVQQDIEQPFDMDGLDDVFFDVGDEVLDDVMEPMATSTAAPSGLCTPRPMPAEGYYSSGVCPGSPTIRCPPDLLQSQHAFWAGVNPPANKLTPQASLLKPVTEENEGFAAVGFVGAAAAAQCATSKEAVLGLEATSCLSKQHQHQELLLQHHHHDKHTNWPAAAAGGGAGCGSPLRCGSPTPATAAAAATCWISRNSLGGEGSGVETYFYSSSNSNNSEMLEEVATSGLRMRAHAVGMRDAASATDGAVELDHRKLSGQLSGASSVAGGMGMDGRGSRRASGRGDAAAAGGSMQGGGGEGGAGIAAAAAAAAAVGAAQLEAQAGGADDGPRRSY